MILSDNCNACFFLRNSHETVDLEPTDDYPSESDHIPRLLCRRWGWNNGFARRPDWTWAQGLHRRSGTSVHSSGSQSSKCFTPHALIHLLHTKVSERGETRMQVWCKLCVPLAVKAPMYYSFIHWGFCFLKFSKFFFCYVVFGDYHEFTILCPGAGFAPRRDTHSTENSRSDLYHKCLSSMVCFFSKCCPLVYTGTHSRRYYHFELYFLWSSAWTQKRRLSLRSAPARRRCEPLRRCSMQGSTWRASIWAMAITKNRHSR